MKNITRKLYILLCLLLCLMVPTTCTKLEKVMLVSTVGVTKISTNSAEASGQVIDLGEGATEYGHCYSKTPNATVACSRTRLGVPKSTGIFKSNLEILEAGTRYYIKAYLSDGNGTIYGKETSFSTASALVPTITTTPISSITTTTASSGGNISSDGGASVTVKGICWSTSANPTISDSKTSDGPGTGSFAGSLTGLTANTTYYVRAYATNSTGTAYGNELSLITNSVPPVVPTLSTTTITGITQTTASSGGNISSDGGTSITARGVCWGTFANPTISDSKTSDGPGTGSFASSLTGLTANTTYYVRAYATNSAGTAYGNELGLITNSVPPVVPTLSTTTITGITQTTASSGGNISSDGGASITARGVCWGTFANTTISDSKTSDGPGSGSFASSLTGLTANTTYYVRAYATNSAGTAYGNEPSFTTNAVTPNPPATATAAATSVTNVTATINGAVNANGSSTTVSFEYGPTILYGSTATAYPSSVAGINPTSVNSVLSGLTPGTTYHFRVKAVNAGGIIYSDDLSFTTLQLPKAITETATSVVNSTATLNGTINATNLSTTVTFEYGPAISYGYIAAATPNPVNGGNPTSVSSEVTGLTSGTTYHFRVKAVSTGGTTYGEDITFTTLQPPTATTKAATSVTKTTATLNGMVNANNSSTIVTFEYGLTVSYGSTATAVQSPVSGTTLTNVSAGITGLTPERTYHFRVQTVSAGGTAYGGDYTFTTPKH